ncbi:MAG: HupE/UreJ family protein [Marinicaulis sp.]|nr:HupE/UreJ family protein [Marinicaulis sp.]
MMRCFAFLAIIFAAAVSPSGAGAHEIRPGYLEVNEAVENSYEIVWKAPLQFGRPLAVAPVFPTDCKKRGAVDRRSMRNAVVARYSLACSEPLSGRAVDLAGIEFTTTDVLVRLQPVSASVETYRASPGTPAVTLGAEYSGRGVSGAYFGLGVEHILQGIDHLLFVAALVLIISGMQRLVETITAFTIAHSLTLIATSLGWVAMPIAPVEAVIALSIVFLANELANKQSGRVRPSEQRPWVVAIIFGLLHGFGFAGALAEIGLPEGDIAMALLMFNIGVEAGQLLFIAGLLIALKALDIFVARRPVELAAAYTIGVLATVWMYERVSGMV